MYDPIKAARETLDLSSESEQREIERQRLQALVDQAMDTSEPDLSNGMPIESPPKQINTKFIPAGAYEGDTQNATLNYDPRPGRDYQCFTCFLVEVGLSMREASMNISQYWLGGYEPPDNWMSVDATMWHMIGDSILAYLAHTLPVGRCLPADTEAERAEAQDWAQLTDAINLVRAHLLSTDYGKRPCRFPW